MTDLIISLLSISPIIAYIIWCCKHILKMDILQKIIDEKQYKRGVICWINNMPCPDFWTPTDFEFVQIEELESQKIIKCVNHDKISRMSVGSLYYVNLTTYGQSIYCSLYIPYKFWKILKYIVNNLIYATKSCK